VRELEKENKDLKEINDDLLNKNNFLEAGGTVKKID
jgi:hypothetical protein